MQLVLILKRLMRRRIAVAVAAFLSVAIVGYVITRMDPAKEQWTASGQVFVDSSSSAIADSWIGLDALGARAGVYANMVASTAVLQDVSKSSGIPADAIGVTGPVNDTGIRAGRSPSASAPGGPYLLQLDVTDPQPIIRITAIAGSRGHALGLANGAAQGLARYVDHLVAAQKIPYSRQVAIRALGDATASPTQLGLSSSLAVPLVLVVFCALCLLLLLSERFVEVWRSSDLDGGAESSSHVTPAAETSQGDEAASEVELWLPDTAAAGRMGWIPAATAAEPAPSKELYPEFKSQFREVMGEAGHQPNGDEFRHQPDVELDGEADRVSGPALNGHRPHPDSRGSRRRKQSRQSSRSS